MNYWHKFTRLGSFFFVCVNYKPGLFQCKSKIKPGNCHRWKDMDAINHHRLFHFIEIRIFLFIRNISEPNTFPNGKTIFAPSNSKWSDVSKFYKLHQNYQLCIKLMEWFLVCETFFFWNLFIKNKTRWKSFTAVTRSMFTFTFKSFTKMGNGLLDHLNTIQVKRTEPLTNTCIVHK